MNEKNNPIVLFIPINVTVAATILSFLFIFSQAITIVSAAAKGPVATNSTTAMSDMSNSSKATIDTLMNSTRVSKIFKIIVNGMISSVQDPLHGHEHEQSAIILPPANDSIVYSGIITFTANKPIEVQIYHLYNTQNNNNNESQHRELSQIMTTLFGDPNVATSVLMPAYGSRSSALFSASVPFTGESLALHTSRGEPFVAIYSVNADINKIQESKFKERSTISSETTSGQKKVEALEPVTSYVTTPNLLAKVLLVMQPEMAAELPLDRLPQKDLVEVLKNIPKEKVDTILNKMPEEKRKEIMDKIAPPKP
jgi:MgtE intracellular N domain